MLNQPLPMVMDWTMKGKPIPSIQLETPSAKVKTGPRDPTPRHRLDGRCLLPGLPGCSAHHQEPGSSPISSAETRRHLARSRAGKEP